MKRPDREVNPHDDADTAIEFVSPGKYSINNPQARTRGAEGPPATTRMLHSQDEIRQHSQQLLQQARHVVRIYSPDLEPWLYSNDPMVEQCKDFLLRQESGRLLILLHDSRRLLAESHRLLPLIERLSSRAQIRLIHPEHEVHPDRWLSVDEHSLLLRKTSAPFQGQLFCGQPARVRPHIEQFEAMWAVSRTDINLRRMTL